MKQEPTQTEQSTTEPKTYVEIMTAWEKRIRDLKLGSKPKTATEDKDQYIMQGVGKDDDFEPTEADLERFMEMMRTRQVLPP